MANKLMSCTAALLAMTAFGSLEAQEKKPARKYDPDAIRCVRLPVTGSLAQVKRTCMTLREWDQNREDARKMQSLTCSNRSQCAGM